MISIENFVLDNKTPFCKILTKINTNNKDPQGIPKKEIIGFPKGYTKFTFEDSINLKSSSGGVEHNQIVFKIPKNYIVIDTDDEINYKLVKIILKHYYIYEKTCITKSFRGQKLNIYYKKHFYFMIDDDENNNFKNLFNGLKHFKGVDIFFDCWAIAENLDNKININKIPIMDFEIMQEIYKHINNEKNNTINVKDNDNNHVKKKYNIDEIREILDNLNHERWDCWSDWKDIYCICLNEDIPLSIFDEYSKKSTKYNKDKNIKELNGFKKINNGLTIRTLMKKLKEDNIDIFNKIQKNKNDISINEYDKIKLEFEKSHFKCINPFMFATILENGCLTLNSRNEFINIHENLFYSIPAKNDEDKDKKYPFVLSWLKDPTIRTYDKFDFLPQQITPSNIYNSFKGYKSEKIPLIYSDIENSLIMKHIKDIICNNNNKIFNYFINFLANLIQHPYMKANTAIILKSIQGAGKDTIFEWFGRNILGEDYYLNTDKLELIFGKFNSKIENKILIVFNEVSGKDTFTINETIKNSITAKVNIVEHKGAKPYENTNNIGYVYLTNNDNPLKIPSDDRRFCAIELNNEKANNKEYFDLLFQEINSCKYDRAFYNYFMNIKIDNFNFISERPITSFYQNMKENNIPIIAKFFENILNNSNVKKFTFESSILFKKFNSFIQNGNFYCEYTITKFGIDIKSYEGIEKIKSGNMFIIIHTQILKDFLNNKYNILF